MNWTEIEGWAAERLTQARNRNDGDLTEVETAKLRGRIATLKEILDLPKRKLTSEAQKAASPDWKPTGI